MKSPWGFYPYQNNTEVKNLANAQILGKKKEIVAEMTDKLKKATSGVLVDYKGITVSEDTALRSEFRKAEVDYTVVKNTLLRFAVNEVGYGEFDPLLNGTTSLAVSEDDAIAPAKIIKEFSTKFKDHFVIKGGFYDGKVISLDEVNSLASIPALPVLQAQVLGTMLAPIVQFALVIKAIAEAQGGTVETAAAEPEAEAEVEAAAEPAAEEPATEEAPAEEAPAAEETAPEAE